MYEVAKARLCDLQKHYQKIEKRMNTYPKGKIHIVKSQNRIQYYLRHDSKDKSGEYISKREEEKIRLYIRKKYDEKMLNVLRKEKQLIESFLKNANDNIDYIRELYSGEPEEIKRYMSPVDVSDEEYAKAWLCTPYNSKPIGSNAAVFITENDEQVRSKSELNIANMLAKYGVPYKYEKELVLSNGLVIHPDFTILDVRNRKEVIWEHRGMMDDKEYAKNAVSRIKLLENEGFVLGETLIITEETMNSPLGTNEIRRIIKRYEHR